MRAVIAAIAAIAAVLSTACGDDAPRLPDGEITELVVVDERIGSGAAAAPGLVAVVHYTGWLYDADARDRRGDRFDTSHVRGRPFEFPIGAQRVIRGWDEGIVGMRVGGIRTLYLPAEYAYGARSVGTIPPQSALVFEIELLELRGGER